MATSLVGWLSDLTGSTAASLFPLGIVLVVGGLMVLLVPRTVNDPRGAEEPVGSSR